MSASIFARAAVSSLLLATTMIASTGGYAQAPAAGHEQARAAETALTSGDGTAAVASSEQAVELAPDNARYRTILGRAYMASGRFASAETSFTEALQLDAADGRAAAGLVLAQLAQGRPGAARANLVDHHDGIPLADLGLLAALTGDPGSAIRLLEAAARRPEADARTRQNLALAYALSGMWREAAATAAIDLGADGAQARMLAWSEAGTMLASRQLALLLPTRAAQDPGRPMTLALGNAAPGAVVVQLADAAPATPSVVAAVEEVAAPAPVQFAGFSGVQFAPRREVVQALPLSYRLPTRPAVAAVAVRRTPRGESGSVVQIGSFDSPAQALAGWRQAARHRSLAQRDALGSTFRRGSRTFYRVALSGFASRDEAVRLCESYRRAGGSCFVRTAGGDRPIQQAVAPAGGAVRLAARR